MIKLIHIKICLLLLIGAVSLKAQDLRWLRVTELQSPINEIGAEFESEFSQGNLNFFSWPAKYSIDQNTTRMKGLWIGCRNFYDPSLNKSNPYKVVASGPRNASDRKNNIFEQEIKLVGKYPHPTVVVDDQFATLNNIYDDLDEVDPSLPSDRMIVVKFNTSMGISVTKKVMVFDSPEHGNYFINDYVFKNTGIYDRAGDVYQQDLNDVYFYFVYRYAFAGVTSTEFEVTWGSFESQWGENTINHNFGDDINAPQYTDPNSLYYHLRGFYSYYGPSTRRLTYDEDWGCPRVDDGLIGAAKYAGCVTLHADKNPQDNSDDPTQPSTTWFIGSDINAMQGVLSDAVVMADRYSIMSEGHPDQPHSAYVDDDFPFNYSDPRRQTGGGTSQGQGFGPYNLQFGDSIHIVFAEGVSGLSWEECRRIGANWDEYFKGTSTPDLILPNGNATTDFNDYKRKWCETGADSIVKTFNNAKRNFEADYNIPKPPPPPDNFTVTSGGNAISLEWSANAVSAPNYDGFVIYRSEGNVLDFETKYVKIFEADKSFNPEGNTFIYKDTSASRGFDYYYYLQSKSDGSDNDIEPGKPLYSSPFWTMTTIPANLQRPPADNLYEVRVVPNPYDARSRVFQFGDQSQYDRIAFYGLPDVCKLKILTERGDIIWEKNHTNGTGDELWDSKTSSGQIVVSGIYILYVQVTEDVIAQDDRVAMFDVYDDKLNLVYKKDDVIHHAGDLVYKKGQSTFRKFVIIR